VDTRYNLGLAECLSISASEMKRKEHCLSMLVLTGEKVFFSLKLRNLLLLYKIQVTE